MPLAAGLMPAAIIVPPVCVACNWSVVLAPAGKCVVRRGISTTTSHWKGALITVPQSDDRPTSLQICLFGPFAVQVDGVPLSRLRSRKGLVLLALLTRWHDREVEREWLAGLLRPERQTSQADTEECLDLSFWRRRYPTIEGVGRRSE